MKKLFAVMTIIMLTTNLFVATQRGIAESAEMPAEGAAVESMEKPTMETTTDPTTEPTPGPTAEPAEETTTALMAEPTEASTVEPTMEPTEEPTVEPTMVLTADPTMQPTAVPTPEQTVTPEPAPSEEQGQVSGGDEQTDIPVRANADGLSEILFMIPHGATVSVMDVEGDWVRISYQGQTGYVYKDSLPSMKVEVPEEEKARPKVTIFSSRKAVMEPGETVVLTSKVEYAEGYEIRYQWECDRGNGFEAVDGANGDTYAFQADEQTLSYDWRLIVYYR